jgi:CHAD domain-containing protein
MPGIAAQKTEKLLSRFEELLHAVQQADEESVHRLRTTSRRIEAVMFYAGFELTSSAEQVLKRIGRLRKQAGKVRDLDVLGAMLHGVEVDSVQSQKEEVEQELQSRRAKHARKLTKKVTAEVDEGLADDLNELRQVINSARSQRAGVYLDRALDEFAEVSAKFPELNESNLHDFRIACRRVRYVAEIAEGLRDGKRATELVKELQDAIGTWHDWTELAQTASDDLGRNAPLVSLLRARRKSAFHHAIVTAQKQREALLEVRTARQSRRRSSSRRKPPTGVRSATAELNGRLRA